MIINSNNLGLNKRIAIPLIIWGAINVLVSAFLLICTSELIKGILLQSFFWGLIDLIIGLFPLFRKKAFVLGKIKKIFLINTYLDVVYMIIGLSLILININEFLIGNGIGVIIQGAFLFVVDLVHHEHVKNLMKR
jgi:hypothetical protein